MYSHITILMQTEQLCFPYAAYAVERNRTKRSVCSNVSYVSQHLNITAVEHKTRPIISFPATRPAAIWFAISAMALNTIDSSHHIICVAFGIYLFHRKIYGTAEVSCLGLKDGEWLFCL